MVSADIVLAVRRLRSRPAAVLGAMAMLVAGIGLATTMFALGDPFLSRPLPYDRAGQLVLIEIDSLRVEAGRGARHPDYPQLRDWESRTDLFVGLAALVRRDPLRVQLAERAVVLETVAVSAGLFRVLGVSAPPAATPDVFGDEVWLMSRTVSGLLAGRDRTSLPLQASAALHMTGVLQPSFVMPQAAEGEPVEALVELAPGPIATTDGRVTRPQILVGRLRDGLDPAQADAALNADATDRGFGVTVRPLEPAMKAARRPLAGGAVLAGLLVLMVCAANALGLALTRGLYRAHQVATLEVLGASRARIARMLLGEAMCVAGVGTAGALVLVPRVLDTVVAVVPRDVIALGAPELSARVVVFAGVAGLLVCGAWWMGSAMAWLRGARASLREAADHDSRILRAVRFGVTTGQVAVTLVLLAGAGLLGRSYVNLVLEDVGLSGDTMALSVSYGPERTGAALQDAVHRTVEGLRHLSGVRRAAAVVGEMVDRFHVIGTVLVNGRMPAVEQLWVTPGYFEAAGMSLVAGRPLGDGDGGGRAIVVNEALIARLLGGRGAVGDSLWVSGRTSPIVGIVRDSRRRALDEPPRPAVFRVLDRSAPVQRVTYVVSGTTPSPGVLEALIRRVSRDAVVLDGSTLRARLARSVQDRAFAMLVVSLFAAATVVVTAAGVVGVVGYGVARRRREIGIRLAVGATSRSVTWLVMGDASAAIGVGAAVGLTVFVWLSDLVLSLLYGVSPTDWKMLCGTTVASAALASAAALVTARRAGRLSPTEALREE